MKNILLLIALVLFINSCKGQKNEIQYHPFVLKAKETSLYSNTVDWEFVNKKFIALTDGKETIEDLKGGLQFLINSLGDKHGHIRSAENHSIVVSYTGEIKEADNRKQEFVNSVINDSSAKFSYKLLDDRIGYLKVVGIGGGDVKEQSDLIREGLVTLKSKDVNKWIVDLRYNGGGNMEPMISGLAPLIGDGDIGGTVDKDRKVRSTFKIEHGQFDNWGRIACEMDSEPHLSTDEKVAVLLSRYTISSGEMLAVAFKGRENTKFFGEPTAGYTTGNGYDVLNDQLILVISQDIYMDRNGVIYENKIDVDVPIEFQHNIDDKNDNYMEQVREWLNQ